MNKKERAQLARIESEAAAAREQIEVARALSWTRPVDPDLPPPSDGSRVFGWSFNGHRRQPVVYRSWSESTRHGRGHVEPTRYESASQRGVAQYSTFDAARAALRHELEVQFAYTLRAVDTMTIDGVEG